jgi:alpha-D-ribose 1-methylphosphonate 5-triphosphate synthase subunit PhnG
MDHSAEQTRGSPLLPEDADLQRRRRAAMAVLAESDAAEIARCLDSIGPLPHHKELRAAEIGLLMVRGRMGGDGAPFNIGEATVTRAAVKLESGETGFGYVLGRDHAKARLVALCDALVQTTIYCNVVEREVVAPIRDRLDAARERKAQQVAATKVEFFTLVRGED